MRLRSRLLAPVVTLLVGVVALSAQSRGRVAGSSGQDGADRESGTIRGTVLAADGESPLAKATVSLRKSGSRRGAGERTARSDDRGEYEFRDLDAGKYLLSVTRNGFLPQNYGQKRVQAFRGQRGGTPLTLGEGQVLGGIDFNLIRGGRRGGTGGGPGLRTSLESHRNLEWISDRSGRAGLDPGEPRPDR